MTGARRRTLSVRGWFAVAALSTFVVVIVVALVSVFVVGNDEPEDRAAHAAAVLRDGADRWDEPAWQEATAAELGADDVEFVLFEDGDDLYRSTGDVPPADTDPLAANPPWGAGRDDGVIRFVQIDGSRPLRSAYVFTPLQEEGVLARLLIATVVIGGVAAAVALAFGRPFVRPLRAAQEAVHRVTDGDLTMALPRSRVTEIDEVGIAFGTMTAELRRSLELQAAIEHERRLFIAAIAHDLRTPLFSLRGYLEGLENGIANDPERHARYLAVANDKARALDELVGNLFDYARLEYLDQSLKHGTLDLAALLGELVEGMHPQADAKGVVLTFRTPENTCRVDADRHQLARAVDNLLDNAVRFTPTGGRVEVACGRAGEATWFTVSDTGPGIAPADLPHLFQPLYRGYSGDNGAAHAGGAGLGLAIAHRILVAHHGTLAANNAPTGGAVVTATLPTSRADTPTR